jgi:hypothetical protein
MSKSKRIISFFLSVIFLLTIPSVKQAHASVAPAKLSAIPTFAKTFPRIPQGLSYKVREMKINELKGLNPNAIDTVKLPGPIALPGTQINIPPVSESVNDLNELKFPIGSKYMIIDQNDPNFIPKPGEIYIDEYKKIAVKILGSATTDSSGHKIVPVIQPEFSEIFESYKIPAQTVKLNEANVSYKRSGVSVTTLPENPPSQQVAALGPFKLSPTASSDDIMFKLSFSDVTLYEYPQKELDENPDEIKKDGKEKAEDDGSMRDNQSDTSDGDKTQKENPPPPSLEGVDEKSDFSMKVYIESGEIKIHKPSFFAEADIGIINQEIKLGLDYQTDMNLTIKGSLKFDKVIETCILGYDVEIPYGRAFVGVFLVVDAKGKVTVTTKVTTMGHIETGFKASAFLFVPYYVGPYCAYKPDSIDVGFTADGEISAMVAAVPKIGLTIFDYNIGELQLWAGVKANAKFHIEADAYADLNNLDNSTASGQGSGSLKVDFFVDLVGYLLNKRYDIFYKEFNMFDGAWAAGQEVKGGGTDTERILSANVGVMADAYTDIIKGSVKTIGSDIPYKGANLTVHVQHSNGQIDNKNVTTNAEGYFEVMAAELDKVKTILPTDRVWADINTQVVTSTATNKDGKTVNVWIDQSESNANLTQDPNLKGRIIGYTEHAEPTVPFDKVSFATDAFNDIVRGQVSGEYTGVIQVIYEKPGANPVQKTAQVNKGEFLYELPANFIQKEDKYTVRIPFEGVYFPKYQETKSPELPYLKINYNVDKNHNITGSVENMMGEYDLQYGASSYSESASNKFKRAYTGSVKLMAFGGSNTVVAQQNAVAVNQRFQGTLLKLPYILPQLNTTLPSSKFAFSNPMLRFVIAIEHDGIVKRISYDPIADLAKRLNSAQQIAATNPVNDKVSSIINPADLSTWAGVWECEYLGSVVFRVDGDKITGTYDNGNWLLNASVTNNKLVGTLDENGGEPKSFEFTLSSDGKVLSGKWYSSWNKAGYALSGKRRVLPSVNIISPAISKSSWTGVWYTDMGTMILNQEGQNIIGTLGRNELPVTGRIVDNTFKGTFVENGHIREFEFNLSSDGTAFEGTWDEESALDDFYWSGYRSTDLSINKY